MRFSVVKLVTLFVLSFVFPLTTYSWNAIGHMVVANIAYQHLQPNVREKIDNLVSYLHKEYPDTGSFLQISYWLDEIRGQHIDTYTHWHYIDMPFSTDGTRVNHAIDTDNAVWAVNHIETVVKNDQANAYERARFLAFLVHIVGDLHQPLHTVSNLTTTHPNGDKGGNLYFVHYNNERINLHKIWDSGLGAFEGAKTIDHVNQITNMITAHYPESSFGKQISDLSAANWAKEGMVNSQKYVYSTPENQPVVSGYVETGKQVSEKEVALAGYRLGILLNQLLG